MDDNLGLTTPAVCSTPSPQQHDETTTTIHTMSSHPLPSETAPHSDELFLTESAATPPSPQPTADRTARVTSTEDTPLPLGREEGDKRDQAELLPHQIDIEQYATLLELTDLPPDAEQDGSVNKPLAAASQPASSLSTSDANAVSPIDAPQAPCNPFETANPLSNLTWWWVGDLFRLGNKRRLLHSDLHPPPREDESANLTACWQTAWQSQLRSNPSQCPSVWRSLIGVFGWRFMWRGLPLLVVSASKIGQSLLLRQLVLFLQWNSGVEGIGDQGGVGLAYFYAVLLFICCLVQSLVQHAYFFSVYRIGGQTRIILSSAIYQQALSLQTTHFLHTSTGGMTNLVAADAGKVEELSIYLTYLLYDTAVEVAVTLGLLLDFIGVSALVGMGVMFSLVPLQAYFSRLFSAFRKQAVHYTDLRVKVVNEILQGAAVVKLYSYERPLERIVTEARENEFRWLRKANHIKCANMAVFFFSSPVINLLTFITYHQLGHTLSPADIFVTVSLFNACRLPVTNYFPTAVQALSEARVSVARIQHFMELGFHDQRTQQSRANKAPQTQPHDGSEQQQADVVVMDNASFKWDAESAESAGLFDLSLRVPAGQLTAIVGSIGAGKSSLLAAILGEMSTLSGSWQVHARTKAYAAQSPWIFADTLRANVLLGRPMQRRRYIETLYACCLIDDVALLPAGDVTVIGDKGVNLSGGQKARVALARAVYGEADLYLFDDCLAALDAVVAQRVFVRCMSDDGLLRGCTRVLVTHQTHFLHQAQQIVLLDGGRLKASGTWTDMVNQADVRSIMHVTGEEGTSKPFAEPSSAPTSPRAAQDDIDAVAASPSSPVSVTKFPTVTAQSNQTPLLSRAASTATSSILNLLPPASTTSASASGLPADSPPDKPAAATKRADDNSIMSDEVSSVGTVGADVYLSLLRVSDAWWGWLWVFFVLVVLMIVGQGVSIASDRWLAIWSSKDAATQDESLYENVYIGLVCGAILLGILRAFTFFDLVLRGARRLHARMFRGVLYSGMRFFEGNPTGRVLNRFSKDQSIVDEQLALISFDAYQMAIMTLGAIASIASVSPYILAIVAPIVPVFLWLRRYYLQSSREVKRLDAVSRSPIYAFFSSTLNGLITLRAFRVQGDFVRQFQQRVDHNTAAIFTFYTSIRWFGVRLDSLCTLIVLATGLLIVGLRNQISAAEAGFALTYSLLLTSLFQWGVRQSAEVENMATSVERIIQYGDLPPEGTFYPPSPVDRPVAVAPADAPSPRSQALIDPGENWPQHGRLVFDNYCMRYREGLPLVLKGLSFEVQPQEKVGVCGTTGAGQIQRHKHANSHAQCSFIGTRSHHSSLCLLSQASPLSSSPSSALSRATQARFNSTASTRRVFRFTPSAPPSPSYRNPQ